MPNIRLASVRVALVAGLMLSATAHAAITYIGRNPFLGNTRDLSCLIGAHEDGSPTNAFDGFGSGIAYTGVPGRYLFIADRGPNASSWNSAVDNTTTFRTRAHTVAVSLTPTANPDQYTVGLTLTNTTLFRGNDNLTNFIGLSSAFVGADPTANLRLDPEGVCVGPDGSIFISDEYGPVVYRFDATGRRVHAYTLPSKFHITTPAPRGTLELPPGNTKGRQANRGMEGLAITPDGTKLYGMMQNALIQDGALNANNGRIGLNNRILEIDIASGATREFVYTLANASNGCNEMVAVSATQLLVIERDGRVGVNAQVKRLYLIDIANATDVSNVTNLPTTGLPAGVTAVAKTLFADFITGAGIEPVSYSAFRSAFTQTVTLDLFPEKLEGLAFGPNLPDGRRTLLISIDNDFLGTANDVWAFALDASDLPGYSPQQFPAGYTFPIDPCPGDVTGDRVCNFLDLNAVLSAFGQSGPAPASGDANHDGVINFLDLNAVLSAFGSGC